jgi:hypothetical protein
LTRPVSNVLSDLSNQIDNGAMHQKPEKNRHRGE